MIQKFLHKDPVPARPVHRGVRNTSVSTTIRFPQTPKRLKEIEYTLNHQGSDYNLGFQGTLSPKP